MIGKGVLCFVFVLLLPLSIVTFAIHWPPPLHLLCRVKHTIEPPPSRPCSPPYIDRHTVRSTFFEQFDVLGQTISAAHDGQRFLFMVDDDK